MAETWVYLPPVEWALINKEQPDKVIYKPESATIGGDKALLIKYANPDPQYMGLTVRTTYVNFKSTGYPSSGYSSDLRARFVTNSFDVSTVTWNTKPSLMDESLAYLQTIKSDNYSTSIHSSFGTARVIGSSNSVMIDVKSGIDVTLTDIANQQLRYLCDDTYSTVFWISNFSPQAGGFLDRALPLVSSWKLFGNKILEGEWPQSNAEFQWKDSSSGVVNTINVSGAAMSVTIPANTFPETNSLLIQLIVTDEFDNTRTEEWRALTTTDATPSTNILSPKDEIIDGSSPVVFSWEHVISTGTLPTGFDIQTSTNGTTWIDFVSMSDTNETSYIAPANSLAAGDFYWRVRSYNASGVAGSWSDAAHCITVAASAAPLIAIVDQSPRFSIRWEQTGQQGYEVMVDGVIVAQRFGAESNYTYDEYLTDGSHTVKVRIQNQYSLWSDWGEVLLSITNTEGEAIVLSVQTTHVAQLIWQPGEYVNYLVYRDGKKIGETKEAGFVDPYSNGSASYQVRGVYSDSGNYGLSNSVTVEIHVPTLMVYDVENRLWLSLEKAATSGRITGISASHNVTYVHYAGQNLPVAEVGEARDRYYNFECAFTHAEKQQAAQFESMLGKVVCIKDQYGNAILSVLDGYSLNITQFYRAFVVTATEIAWDGVTG